MVWGLQLKERLLSPVGQSISRITQTSSCNSGLHYSAVIMDAKKTGSEVTSTPSPSASPRSDSRMPGAPMGNPTALDKKFLVWSKMFKSASEIPKQLDGNVIHRVRSWGRIRINIGFLFIAAAGGGLMVYLGKRAAARGESMEQQNLEWHRKIKEDYELEQRGKQK